MSKAADVMMPIERRSLARIDAISTSTTNRLSSARGGEPD
jgi:hypothetical protein